MSSEDEMVEWEENHFPELIQCEVPKVSEVGLADFLEAWLLRSSVGQNVKALQDQTRGNIGSPVKEEVPQAPKQVEVNGKDTPKAKGRVRKAGNLGGDRSAKKSSSLPVSSPDPVPMSAPPISDSSGSPESCVATCWNPSDEQISLLVQKVLALELQQAGFDSSETRALAVFSDVTERYIVKLARNLRFILDRYCASSVEKQPLWHMWLRSMHVSLTELPLFAHQDVITAQQRIVAARCEDQSGQVPHEHVALAALVQENKHILEAFQQDQPVRLSRQRMQTSSPPRDYSTYFDPTVDAVPNFQYSLDTFPPHMAPLPQNLDPTDAAYAYPTSFPYYASGPSFEPDKANFYGYPPNTLTSGAASPSIVPFPPRRDSRSQ